MRTFTAWYHPKQVLAGALSLRDHVGVPAMQFRASTDPIRPAERQAFWTEAICRSFANVETKPLGRASVSGHFEFIEIGKAKLVRFDTSPQCYSRDSRLVSKAGSDDFMFDFQTRDRSSLVQGASEGDIEPGFGVLYDARRPFEDRLDGPGQRAEVLIVTVPAALMLDAFPDAEHLCAIPIPLSGAVARSIMTLVRRAVREPAPLAEGDETGIVAYMAALLRQASGNPHGLGRANLFMLIDVYLRRNLAAAVSPVAFALQFGISERTFHRIFADRGTTFERHALRRRVERFRDLLTEPRLRDSSIAKLALECGFADAAHASRTFKQAFGATPRDYRSGAALIGHGMGRAPALR
jgi:AraC family transcriptional regulator, positive regulator of tynA and feaB